MIRTAVETIAVRNSSARAGAALAAVAGIVLLSGCSPAADSANADSANADATSDTGSTGGSEPAYADGTYTAEGSYATPETVETISVIVTLESDVITAVEVVGDPQKAESQQYQGEFIGGISDAVVGQDIDEISVSRVAGSSLTSGGFNQAIEAIKAEAAL